MKLALVGDIHSNHVALRATLAQVAREGVDGVVFLGDYVSDFPSPQKTLALLRECKTQYQTWFLRGNREEYMIGRHRGEGGRWTYCSQHGSLLYTYENLTDADIRFFEAMPIAATIRPEGCAPFAVCHASPEAAREYIADDEARMRECLDAICADLLFCGHTHAQKACAFGNRAVYFIGSAGLSEGAPGMAQFALMESEGGGWRVELTGVPYDADEALAEFDSSGLGQKAGMWARAVESTVRTGRNACRTLIHTVARLARQDGKTAPFAIPEEYWIAAAAELGI